MQYARIISSGSGWADIWLQKPVLRDALTVILIRLNPALFFTPPFISLSTSYKLTLFSNAQIQFVVQLWHLKVLLRAVLEKIRLQQCRGSFFTRPPLFRSKSILLSWRPCGDNTLSTESEFMSLATLKGTRWFVWLWKGTIRQTAELLWDTWKRPHPCGHKATSHIFTMKTMPVLQHLLRSEMNGGLQYGRDYYKREEK